MTRRNLPRQGLVMARCGDSPPLSPSEIYRKRQESIAELHFEDGQRMYFLWDHGPDDENLPFSVRLWDMGSKRQWFTAEEARLIADFIYKNLGKRNGAT